MTRKNEHKHTAKSTHEHGPHHKHSEHSVKKITHNIKRESKSYLSKMQGQWELLKDRGIEFINFYGPKAQRSVTKYTKLYQRKFKEAYIAFRKDY